MSSRGSVMELLDDVGVPSEGEVLLLLCHLNGDLLSVLDGSVASRSLHVQMSLVVKTGADLK